MKSKQASFLSSRSYCDGCAPRFRAARFLMIAGFALCLVIGYAVGHRRAGREPFYLIGTPVDPDASHKQESKPIGSKAVTQDGQQQSFSINAGSGICGALTKSGKPCRRKVAGGGYCWQHRDKIETKKSPVSWVR